MAEWAFSVMGHHPRTTGRAIFCEEHATFYLRHGPNIYPAARKEPSDD